MKKEDLIFFDTETTGNREEDVLCQIAYRTNGENFCELYKPAIPIPPEASAVTHITNRMVENKNSFTKSPEYNKIKNLFEDENKIIVAHNARFDVAMMQKEDIVPKNVICTLRVARALDKENKIPQYKLQYLRYYLDIDIDAQAHDALGDVLVLEQLFERLYKKLYEEFQDEEKTLKEMIAISLRPSLMYTINFGKYNGKTVEEIASIDRGYLEWLLAQKEANNPDNKEDWIYTLKYHLGKL